jgi:sporulation integral membrane protein YtvI
MIIELIIFQGRGEKMLDISSNTLIKLGKLLLFILLVTGIGYFFVAGFNLILTTIVPWFIPFILALIIALLVDPLVGFLERKLSLSRTFATVIGLIIFFLFIGSLLILLSIHVIVEIINLSANLPEYIKLARLVLEDAIAKAEYLQYLYLVDFPPAFNDLTYYIDNIAIRLREISEFIIHYILFLISSLPGILTLLIVMAVATFFLTRDKKELANAILAVIPVVFQPKLLMVSSKLIAALIGFIRAQLILISITGLQTVIGLYLIGVEYALTVGILVGMIDILPIIGPGIIFIPWTIILLLMGNTGFALALLFLYGMIIVVRSILEPKVVADNIGLHPLTTLLGIYVGLKAMGVIGVIIGPIIIIIIKAIWYTKIKT